MIPQFSQYPSQKPSYPQTSHPIPNYQQPPQQGQSSGNHQMSLQELFTYLAQSQTQFQQETMNTFSNIQAQIGYLATAFNKMEQRATPKEPIEPNIDQIESSNKTIKPLVIPPHFPSWLAPSKKQEEEKEFLKTFRKVQIKIPLLDAIKQIPCYAKFLKDLCTNKRKFKANEKIQVNSNVFVVIQKKLPPKSKDPGIFAIPCTISDLHVESAMLDLGDSINVMPYSVFESLNIGPLEETGVIIQLAYKSSVSQRGVLEDALVQVNKLVFPTHFYVIDIEEKNPSKSSMILLVKPFMNTAHTIIDVHKGKITMEFNGETIHFNIFEAMRYPSNIYPLYWVDVIEIINEISPTICTHKIFMEDDCKRKREAQIRLNPPMMEVIKKKIIKRFKMCKEKKKAFHEKHIT
ncbi:uncharacterized protein LOC111908972 [Lactuca sativa]|uniref:uncharacterized protein LOC111908972 n=1 Tax=Lactuca sativa TaxID=4236 RepID=UPI0022B07825|nr:uncharacterized protein LOC111908972 [Lactuca sativa]